MGTLQEVWTKSDLRGYQGGASVVGRLRLPHQLIRGKKREGVTNW